MKNIEMEETKTQDNINIGEMQTLRRDSVINTLNHTQGLNNSQIQITESKAVNSSIDAPPPSYKVKPQINLIRKLTNQVTNPEITQAAPKVDNRS